MTYVNRYKINNDMMRQRKTTTTPRLSSDGPSLPHYKNGWSSQPISQRNKLSAPSTARYWSRLFLLIITFLLITTVVLDRIWVSISLSSFPNYKELSAAVSPLLSIDKANIAIISIHRGFKFLPLGKFLRDSKRSYAGLHGYAFIDESHSLPDDEYNNNLPEWMKVGNRAMYNKQPRILLHLMEKYNNLDWLMLIDGDAIITQPYVSIEDQLEKFTALHHSQQLSSSNHHYQPLSFVGEDDSPNSGLILIRNVQTSREYLKTTINSGDNFIRTSQVNRTFTDSALLLKKEQGTLLQSRVRGPASGRWTPGHWSLHLSNHSYLEMLSSLRNVGSQLAASPPSIFPRLARPSLESLSKERKDRFEKVQAAIRHAWRGYADVCLYPAGDQYKYLGSHIPLDDLSPVSGRGDDWLYHAATLYDSLDTLSIAFGVNSYDYNEALDVILKSDLQSSAMRPTKTFEYSLRILGGLLGAFSVTGDLRLLSRARDSADALLQGPFASSPTALPRMYDVLYPPRGGNVLYRIYAKLYEWARDTFTNEHHYNSLAGVGTFSLEFYFLSQVLGTDKYRVAADKIFQHVEQYQNTDGTIPAYWNVMTGLPTNYNGGLGSGSDSFVEYLLKVPLLACTGFSNDTLACDYDHPQVKDMLELYHKILKTVGKHTVTKKGDSTIVYPADDGRYHQLLCFLPGLLALESSVHDQMADKEGRDDFTLATSLVRGCHDMYEKSSPLGLGPEEVTPNQKLNIPVGDKRYLLRPEYVESLFVLYRLTGNQEYQEMGWEVFLSLEHYCKTDFGYAGIKDVYQSNGIGWIDDMPSYFIAETLKYLLLLFGPDDFLSLNNYVFTTEAHPMRRMQTKGSRKKFHKYIQTELSNRKYEVQSPFPWLLATIVAVAGILIGLMMVSIKKAVLTFVIRHDAKNE